MSPFLLPRCLPFGAFISHFFSTRDLYRQTTRSSTNPAAFEFIKQRNDDIPMNEITSSQERTDHGSYEQGWNWILDSQITPRKGGEQWAGSDTLSRPHIIAARNLLIERWHPRISLRNITHSFCYIIYINFCSLRTEAT